MYKGNLLNLPAELRETAAIQRRRNAEEQRKSRIFNPKVRQIGVDLQSLNQQKLEREKILNEEKQRSEKFAAELIRNDNAASFLARREAEERRQQRKSLDDFRTTHQKREMRREFDLYNPDQLKKERPSRTSDEDPRCGPCTGLQFAGEDLEGKERKKMQQSQQQSWLQQQMEDKTNAEEQQKQADRVHNQWRMRLDQQAYDLQKLEKDFHMALQQATADYNLAMAREQAAYNKMDQQQEEEDNMAEIVNHLTGDLLTENRDVACSAFGAHRVITDRWKGMTDEQLADVRKSQLKQIEENKSQREVEVLENEEWEKKRLACAKTGQLLEEERDKNSRKWQKDLMTENIQLAEEQTAHKEWMNKVLCTNIPSEKYFQQFNTTSR